MQRMALIKLLREFDVDKNGTVTKEEFRRGVKAVGVRAPLHELNALFNSFDVDLDGTLSHDELLTGLAKAGFISKYDGTTQEGWKRESSAIYTMEAEDEMNGEGTGDLEVAVDEPFMQAQKQGGAVVQGADAAKAIGRRHPPRRRLTTGKSSHRRHHLSRTWRSHSGCRRARRRAIRQARPIASCTDSPRVHSCGLQRQLPRQLQLQCS